MVKNISNNKITIVSILLVIVLFYWFSWRPTHIRSYCSDWALRKAIVEDNPTMDSLLKGGVVPTGLEYEISSYKNYYSRCLHDKGL